nr:MAG TPA: Sister chromatid cohesion protein 2 loader, HEAT repeat, Scc2.85A [Caudoviricetes sp.]
MRGAGSSDLSVRERPGGGGGGGGRGGSWEVLPEAVRCCERPREASRGRGVVRLV